MTNEQNVTRSVFNSYINDIKTYSTRPNTPMIKMLEDVRDKAIEALEEVEKHKETFDWCTDCKEYDSEAHCCHRWSKCINETVNEIKSTSNTGKWIDYCGGVECSVCGHYIDDNFYAGKYCSNCGARMGVEDADSN